MIDWIDKLPDSLTGAVAAMAVWFGANYAFLAERAMAKDHVVTSPSCIDAVERHQRAVDVSPSGIGAVIGMPGFDLFEREMLKLVKPRMLSGDEKTALCACAAKMAARTLRFDYAIHTASFRIIEPSAVAALGTATITTVMSGVCGALPAVRRVR